MNSELIIATRSSKLALCQSLYVKRIIEESYAGISCKLIKVKTKGDKILNEPLYNFAGKELFTKELDTLIINGNADIAVHSLKDIPLVLQDKLTIGAYSRRESPYDVFVSNRYHSLESLPRKSILGTSSVRRKAQILAYRNDLIIKNIRGNIDTRLNKIDLEGYDGIIIAAASLIRLNIKSRIKSFIPMKICLPAAGQGVIAVECLKKNTKLIGMLSRINNKKSEICVKAERFFAGSFGNLSNCNSAISSYATFKQDNLFLTGMVLNSTGTNSLTMNCCESIETCSPEELAKQLFQKMVEQGARNILKS